VETRAFGQAGNEQSTRQQIGGEDFALRGLAVATVPTIVVVSQSAARSPPPSAAPPCAARTAAVIRGDISEDEATSGLPPWTCGCLFILEAALAPCCAGSTAAVGSRVCDFACRTDAGVELPTSRTRPVPTSDAELPLSLAVKEQASSRGRPPPLPWSCAVAGHPSAVLSRSVRICCLSSSYSRTDKRPRSSSATARSSFTSGSSVSLAALFSWAALHRGRPPFEATLLGRRTVEAPSRWSWRTG
jgi:hypothetical protein